MLTYQMYILDKTGKNYVKDRFVIEKENHHAFTNYISLQHSTILIHNILQGGLTIVDIYSEWAGPCTAMSGALKKIKLEVGDDSLIYAMAKSDSIPQLEKFRGHCKPTYLFIASGIHYN